MPYIKPNQGNSPEIMDCPIRAGQPWSIEVGQPLKLYVSTTLETLSKAPPSHQDRQLEFSHLNSNRYTGHTATQNRSYLRYEGLEDGTQDCEVNHLSVRSAGEVWHTVKWSRRLSRRRRSGWQRPLPTNNQVHHYTLEVPCQGRTEIASRKIRNSTSVNSNVITEVRHLLKPYIIQ